MTEPIHRCHGWREIWREAKVCVRAWMDCQRRGDIDGWMDRWSRWMDANMNGWMDAWVGGWRMCGMHTSMDVWRGMDGEMQEGWMEGVWMHVMSDVWMDE